MPEQNPRQSVVRTGLETTVSLETMDRWAQEVERLRQENQRLRDGFCDEAYILMVQALDVKALGKGRRRILTEQAIRMAKVGLSQGWPRYGGRRERLHELAMDVLNQLGAADA